MNIKQLREAIKDLPDDAEILLSVNSGNEGDFETISKRFKSYSRGEFTKIEYVWGDKYQTREVRNGYQCNDDRYGGPVLCIEVGELSY